MDYKIISRSDDYKINKIKLYKDLSIDSKSKIYIFENY